MPMTDKEIVAELRKEKKDNERILKELVEKRVKNTSKEKFSLQEIYDYSNYFGIPMSTLLLQILSVEEKEYKKLSKGYKKHIHSEKFCNKKQKLIKKVKNIYKYRVNWNIKNYFNKQRIEGTANTFNINALDFAKGVLQKSYLCIQRVLKDDTNMKRFYIGQYVNTSLPMEYVDKNYKLLEKIAKIAVRKAINTKGIKYTRDEYNEEVQKCLVYAVDKGNSLNKLNKPVIHSEKYRKSQGSIIYCKVFYYELSEIYKMRFVSGYNEKIGYMNKRSSYIDEEHEVKNFIENFALNDLQAQIIRLINDGYTKDEIIAQKGISLNIYDEIIEGIKAKILEQKIA